MSEMAQFWIGSTDVHFMLTQIGGWHVDCYNHRQAQKAVEYVEQRRLVGRRKHFAPAFPEGVEAFELTDNGLIHVAKHSGAIARARCEKTREWYRQKLAEWLRTHGQQESDNKRPDAE